MKTTKISTGKYIAVDNQGFTMIEVLMAMAIFLIGFLAVSSMQISAANGNASARLRTSASILAADIVEQLLRCPYDSAGCSLIRPDYVENDPLALGAHPGPAVTDWFDDDPDEGGPDRTYQVRWFVSNGPEVGSKEIDVIVRWQKKGQNNSVQYTFLAADANL
jgi:prepilin-type N-terminal cleavage/methylation domain-containing protein